MDIKQQCIHAFATKQAKEWTTFSYKVISEATEEKLKINSTGNFQYTHGCVCTWEKIHGIQIYVTQLINTNQNINSSSEDSQNLGKKRVPNDLELQTWK